MPEQESDREITEEEYKNDALAFARKSLKSQLPTNLLLDFLLSGYGGVLSMNSLADIVEQAITEHEENKYVFGSKV